MKPREIRTREISARYPGVCKHCGRKIEEGQKIWWAPGHVYHAEHFNTGEHGNPEDLGLGDEDGFEAADWPEDPDPGADREEWFREMDGLAWEYTTADGSLGRADVGTEEEGHDPEEGPDPPE